MGLASEVTVITMATSSHHKPMLIVFGLMWCLNPLIGAADQGASTPQGPSATCSLREIQAGVARSRQRLRNLLVEFVCTRANPITGELAADSLYDRVAARGVARLWEDAHFSNNRAREVDWDSTIIYFTGKTLDVYCPLLGYFETSHRNATLLYPWKTRAQFYWECFGWWPPDDPTPRPPGWPALFLHDVLAQKQCIVRPRQEQVDGVWCHVIEVPGLDTLWIDPSVGFGIRRRLWAGGNSGMLYTRYELSDFREMKPDIWIPWRLRRIVYDTAVRKPGTTPTIIVEGRATVVRAVVNEVPEDLFQFKPPPGTLVQNRDSGQFEQIPGGLAFLDTVIKTVLQVHPSFTLGRGDGAGALAGYVVIALTLVLAMLDLWLLGHLFRSFRQPCQSSALDRRQSCS